MQRTFVSRSSAARFAVVTFLILAMGGSALGQHPWAAPLPIFPYWHPGEITKGNWDDISGRVAETNLISNELVIIAHGKTLRLVAPPRIDVSKLKAGDKVSIVYIADKGRFRVWSLELRR